MANGSILVDTPGMRELGLVGASEGIGEMFSGILELAEACRFEDCAHEEDLGCAVQAAVEDGRLDRNPCQNLGKLLAKVGRQQSEEVRHVDSWSREEVVTLLEIARAEEPAFHPLLAFLLSTGCRKGEALGLKWQDGNLIQAKIHAGRKSAGEAELSYKGRAKRVKLEPGKSIVLGPADFS